MDKFQTREVIVRIPPSIATMGVLFARAQGME